MLTDAQLKKVKMFATDREMFDAVKLYLLENFEPNTWHKNVPTGLRNEEYGERIKTGNACYVELGFRFDDMQKLIEPDKPKEKKSYRYGTNH